MAGLMIAKMASLAVLVAAPVALASSADARSCGLCWETATNQAHTPTCTGIFEDSALASCLCNTGNKAIFDLCETACAGTGRAPSTVCSDTALVESESQSCALCWETATNQTHSPICTGLSDDDTAACLCKQGNRAIFNTCNIRCKGFSKYMPKNACRNMAARDAQGESIIPWKHDEDYEKRQEHEYCSPVPHGSCSKSPGDVKRVPQGESIMPWKHEGDDDDDDQRQLISSCTVPHGACGRVPSDVKRIPQGGSNFTPCGVVPKSSCSMGSSTR